MNKLLQERETADEVIFQLKWAAANVAYQSRLLRDEIEKLRLRTEGWNGEHKGVEMSPEMRLNLIKAGDGTLRFTQKHSDLPFETAHGKYSCEYESSIVLKKVE